MSKNKFQPDNPQTHFVKFLQDIHNASGTPCFKQGGQYPILAECGSNYAIATGKGNEAIMFPKECTNLLFTAHSGVNQAPIINIKDIRKLNIKDGDVLVVQIADKELQSRKNTESITIAFKGINDMLKANGLPTVTLLGIPKNWRISELDEVAMARNGWVKDQGKANEVLNKAGEQ